MVVVICVTMTICCTKHDGNDAPAFEGDFRVTLTEVTKTTASFTIEASDPAMEYFMVVYDAPFVEDFVKDEYLVGTIYEELTATAAQRGITFDEYMAMNTEHGNISGKFSGLATDTKYYMLLFGVDAANEYAPTTEVLRVNFTTQPAPQSDATFEVQADVLMNSVTFKVTPSDNEIMWHLLTVTKSMYDTFTDPNEPQSMTTDAFYTNYLQSEINNLLGAGVSSEEVVSRLMFRGAVNLSAKGLSTHTEHVYLVAGLVMDSDGMFVATPVTVGTYTTEDAAPSDMTFKITVSDIGQFSAAIRIEPSNDTDRYCALIQAYDGHSSAVEVMNGLIEHWGGWMDLMADDYGVVEYSSESKFRLETPDTEYYVIAFGYDGGVTTAPEMVTFRTLAGGDPEDATFSMEASNVSAYGMRVTIESSDATVYYTVGITTPAEYDEAELIQAVNDEFDHIYEQASAWDPSLTIAQALGTYYSHGNNTLDASGLQMKTEYMGYIFVHDPNTGHIIKTHTFEKLATTTAKGSLTPTIELVGYYSGDDEAGEVFGDASVTKGNAITVVRYTGIESATSLYCAIIPDDYTNVATYPDDIVWSECQSLWQEVSLNKPYSFLLTEWNRLYTTTAYATDQENLTGSIARLSVQPTAQKKSPIDEFFALIGELYPSEQSLCTESIVVCDSNNVVDGDVMAEPMLRQRGSSVAKVKPAMRKLEHRKSDDEIVIQTLNYVERAHLAN